MLCAQVAYSTVCIYYVYKCHTVLHAQVACSAVCVDGILYYVYMWHLFCMLEWHTVVCAQVTYSTVCRDGMLYYVH